MTVKQINAHLDRAREIIGDRSPGEVAYDDAEQAGFEDELETDSLP